MATPNKIDSNATGMRYAEESSLGTLPNSPTWYPLEPNKSTDFGGKLATVARNPINPSRQRRKGTVTDLDASGGFESDLTQSNLTRLLQGFLFADARQKKCTLPLNGSAIAITAVDGSAHTFAASTGFTATKASQGTWPGGGDFDTVLEAHAAGSAGNAWQVVLVGDSAAAGGVTVHVNHYGKTIGIHYESGVSTITNVETAVTALAGDDDVIDVKTGGTGATVLTAPGDDVVATSLAGGWDPFLVSHLVKSSGFAVSTNNGLSKLTTVAAGVLTTTGLANESVGTTGSAPPATAKIEAVGYEFASATLDVTMMGGFARLNRASGTIDFTTLGLIPGEWIYLGGDSSTTTFANNHGFARVLAVTTTAANAASYIDLDKTSWTPVAETGTAKTVRVFFGTVLKNESDPTLIKRRTYQLERTLGQDADGTMSELIVGAASNDLALNVKSADKVTVDLAFIAIDHEQRSGATGVKAGSRPAIASEDAFNTSSDFSRIKLATVDLTTGAPAPLFAFATDLTLNVKNNVEPTKAIGRLGAFDLNVGQFDVSGKVTVYFADIASVQAVRNNADVSLDIAIAKNNAGQVWDIPLLGLGDGRLAVEPNKAITLPLEMNAAASKFDHTLLVDVFPYLPTAAQ